MSGHQVRTLTSHEVPDDLLEKVRLLMDEAFPDFHFTDWDHALGGHHFVVEDGGSLLAHASVVPRILEVDGVPFRTGYVEAAATRPDRQREGLGTLVMVEANAVVRERYELGGLGTSAHHFYERLGWERWQGLTYIRGERGLVRSPEEDDGVMVLRFGPSASVDLTTGISCEPRPGDDW